MQSPTSDTTLTEQGIAALNTGDKTRALDLLAQALLENPIDERAWLWLSGVVEGDAERKFCLEQARRINPKNEATQRGLTLLPSDTPSKSPLLRYIEQHRQAKAVVHHSHEASPASSTFPVNAPSAPVSQIRQTIPPDRGKTKLWLVLLVMCCITGGVGYIGYLEFFTDAIDIRGMFGTSDKETRSMARALATAMATKSTPAFNSPVKILDGWSCQNANIQGFVEIRGQVRNDGDRALSFVSLRGTLVTQSGTIINTKSGFIDSDVLSPNATSTYRILINNPSGVTNECRLVVENYRPAL